MSTVCPPAGEGTSRGRDQQTTPDTLPNTFPAEPWSIREVGLDLESLARSESMFALANGHLGLRANLDEGEPSSLSGTYLNGFFEAHRISYAELGVRAPEAGQTIVNVTNGKMIRLLVEDEPFDVHCGSCAATSACSTCAAGMLRRRLSGARRRAVGAGDEPTRLVSFASQRRRHQLRGRAARRAAAGGVQSELLANEATLMAEADPRAAAALPAPLRVDVLNVLTTCAWCWPTRPRDKRTVGRGRHGPRDRGRRHAGHVVESEPTSAG